MPRLLAYEDDEKKRKRNAYEHQTKENHGVSIHLSSCRLSPPDAKQTAKHADCNINAADIQDTR